MDADLFFVIGLALLILAVPPTIGALMRSDAPRTSAILVLIGGVLFFLALRAEPSRYRFDTVGAVVAHVFDRYVAQPFGLR